MTELQLRVQMPGTADRIVTVNKDDFRIGRSSECDFVVSSYGISRQHLRLSYSHEKQGWMAQDLGSKNGTRLNQSPLIGEQGISHGDRIVVETVCFVVLLKAGSAMEITPANIRAGNSTSSTRSSPPTQTNIITRLPDGIRVDGWQPQKAAGAPMVEKSPHVQYTAISSLPNGKMGIARNAKALQDQWLRADERGGKTRADQEQTIARLQELVKIAKALTLAESSEAIFLQVQQVVFRYLTHIQRIALLVDIDGSQRLRLLNAGARDDAQSHDLTVDASWIGRSVCNKAFREQIAIQIADAQNEQEYGQEQSMLQKGILSAMAVPLWDEDKVVGVLYADANLSSETWMQEGEEDLSFFSALANLVAASVQRWLLSRKLKREEQLCQKLGRYHSPSVVQQMMAAGQFENGRIPPKDAYITLVFADIVGFTSLSERLNPVSVANLLNNFFEEMLTEIFDLGGTLDKFIGDCIMAFFGAPEPLADHALRATTAAYRMLRRLEQLNADGELGEKLQLRIAINSGRAFVGDVGSSQRMEYTVLGGTVNLAARMEAMCPPGQCVISQSTYNLLPELKRQHWSKMGEHYFKGIERPVSVYQLKQLMGDAELADMKKGDRSQLL
ncbi:MAG: adenylate/guanylate cyclase domain-containing protein [Cyanobacteria bacterium P01_C01_bin.89]